MVEIWSQVGPYAVKSVVGLIFTGLLAVIVWPFRKARQEWITLKNNLQAAHNELVQQRTNCLNTLQKQGEEQIKLLGKMADATSGIRLDLAEQTGYLSALASQPVRRRRITKK